MTVALRGGDVLDGLGGPAVRADVLVRAGVVVAHGTPDTVIDVTGLVVCPGFVDLHSHSDLTLLSAPRAPSKVRQGVTTEVVGNCGLGVAPIAADVAELRAAAGYLDLDPAVPLDWQGFGEYLDALAAARTSVNVAALVPHLPLHAAAAGWDDGPADLDRLRGLLAESFAAGAAGVSTGLCYGPLVHAGEDELTAIGAVAAEHGRVFAWHLRDYGAGLLDAVDEALRVAERTGCRTQLSHLVSVGRKNWGGVAAALERVDAARDRGLDVAVDVYPYLAGNAPLSQLLPAWAQNGGADAMKVRLADPDVRARVATEWQDLPWTWDEITVSRVPAGPDDAATGRTLAQLGDHPADVALDLLHRHGNAVLAVGTGRSEDDLLAALRHPASVIGSDGLALDPDGPTGAGQPHPRSYGTYPRLLRDYVGPGRLSLAEAVAKCTSAPAERAGLRDRGVLAPGRPADIVVLDPAAVADRATYTDPQRYPGGIALVMVNGTAVVDGRGHTGARPGSVLRVEE
ncbi:N-acyl-D-amino-acid deacylase family protein [Jiangella anatolica]|uniref:N-acyl-D-amino-acid deacylase n=1 Tax=Jiangella anatolica TaxID=2670374 RepID=A0A2W2BIP1_9ACTN|nr:D-aminoacylase [Jiangella anatolica]PZF85862.1 N-acyl-D-amino-acid deacylase [Jiangella anatolica]